MPLGSVYLIPNVLGDDENALSAIPQYVLPAIKNCTVFFVENEKVARRYLKKLWKEMVIDDYYWFAIHKAEETVKQSFAVHLQNGSNIGIISDAGCPGVADPGQILIDVAQKMNAKIHPLVGPNSILLALMASGMNGQQFQFNGYLPIESQQRKNAIRHFEDDSYKRNCTQIFIETPYRNNALLNDFLSICKAQTRLCIAADITTSGEMIITKTIQQWKKETVDLQKHPTIFLLSVG